MILIDALKLRLRFTCSFSSTTCCAEPTSGASTSAKYLTDIQAIIRYAQQENLPGLDYARIQENIREYEEGLALGNEQPGLLQAIEIQIRNSDPVIQKLMNEKKPGPEKPGQAKAHTLVHV